MNKFRVVILILSFLSLNGNFDICLSQDIKAKIEERLQRLKQELLYEQEFLYGLNEKLKGEIQRLSEENSRFQLALKQAEKNYALLSQEINSVKQEKHSLQAEQKELTDKLKQKEAELITKLAESEQTISSLKEESKEQLALLNEELVKLKTENTEKQRQLEEIQSSYNQLIQERDSLQAEYKELTNQLQTKEAAILSLEKKSSHFRDLNEENFQLRLSLKQAEEEYAKLTQELNSLKQKLELRPKEKVVYEHKPDPEQERQIKQLRQENTELERLLQQMTKRVKKLNPKKDRKIFNPLQIIYDIDEWMRDNLW